MSSYKLCRKKLIFSEEEETTHLPSCPPQSPSSKKSTPKSPPSCDPNPMLRIYLPRFAELFPTKPDVANGQIDSAHPHEVNAETFTSPTSKSLVPTTSLPLTQLTPTSQLHSPPHANPASNILVIVQEPNYIMKENMMNELNKLAQNPSTSDSARGMTENCFQKWLGRVDINSEDPIDGVDYVMVERENNGDYSPVLLAQLDLNSM